MPTQRTVRLPEEENAAISFGDWLTSLGNATRSAMAGKWGAAGRSLEDFVLDPIDAIVPGNAIPRQQRQGDQTNFDEVIGGMEPGLARSLTNIVGNTATDPLTALQFLPGGRALLPKAGRQLLSTAEKVPALKEALYGLRKATGNVRKGERVATAMGTAQGKEMAVERGWHDYAAAKLQPYDKGLRTLVFDTVQNVIPDAEAGPGKFKPLVAGDKRARYMSNDAQIRDALERAKLHPDYGNYDPKQVKAAIEDVYGISHGMFAQIGHHQAWDMPGAGYIQKNTGEFHSKADVDKMFGKEARAKMTELGVNPDEVLRDNFEAKQFDPETMSSRDYLRRSVDVDEQGRKANSLKAREYETPEAFAERLNQSDVTGYNRDALQAIAERIPGQGGIVRRQTLSDELFGKGTIMTGQRGKGIGGEEGGTGQRLFKQAVDHEVSTGKLTSEEADALHTMYNGPDGAKPTGWVEKVLDYGNKRFKQAAVYGILIPKFSSLFRNRIGTAMQAFGADGVSNAAAWNQLKTAVPDTIAAIVHDGMGLKMPLDKMTKTLRKMDAAFEAGGGRAEKAAAYLRSQGDHRLAQALELGVVDSGFVSAERMLDDAAKTKWANARDAPEKMFQGTEQRARLGLFMDMLDETGSNAKQAAAKVRDSLYDYSFSSEMNRKLRRWIPFAQFTFQAIPREGGKLLRNPAALSAVSNLYGQDEENPLPEWMASRAHIATGKNSSITGLGLPLEALTSIPNPTGGAIGESLWNTINQMQPLVKSAAGFIADRDPFTGAEFGGTQKLPFASDASSAGKAYRVIEGTGLAQGITGPLQMAETLTNPNRETASTAAQVFLGPTAREFDPVNAEMKLLEKKVRQNPDVQKKSLTTYAAREGADEDTTAMLSELLAMRRQLSKATKVRKAAASEGANPPPSPATAQ